MHFFRMFCAVGLLTCVTLNPALSADPVENEGGHQVSVAVEDVVRDDLIERRLQRIFAARPRYDELTIEVESGIVTLSGEVESADDAEWARSLAERTEGVILADNRVRVLQHFDVQENMAIIRSSLTRLWSDLMRQLPLIVAAAVVLVITATFAKGIGWAIMRLLSSRLEMRRSLKDLIFQLATIGTWVLGSLVAAVVAFPGMTPARAITFFGLGSVAIGFAFKDIFENFFAGILILWRYPFDRGDFISAGDLMGRVEEITIRNTLIRRLDGELMVVPNAHLFKNAVDVLTDQRTRRVVLDVGVSYGTDVEHARRVICDATRTCWTVESDQLVEVTAKAFGESSIDFEVTWFTGSRPSDVRRSRDEVVASIKNSLDEAGIEIPFPYRTLTFNDPIPIELKGPEMNPSWTTKNA